MNRMDRLTAIILLLQSRRSTASEIASRFEISRRTVFRDIQALCEMGIPVITEAGPQGGYTLPAGFSLAPLQLTLPEVLLLRLALSSVTQLADTPFKQERESLLAKIQALIPHQHSQDTEKLLANIHIEIPSRKYELPWIEKLLQCAHKGQWVSVTYHSERGISTQTLQPQRLYTASGFWYCRAYAYEHQQERTYRVDRFKSVASVAQPPAWKRQEEEPVQPYSDPTHPEVVIRLSARGVLIMESDFHLGGDIQLYGEDGGILNFRCPPTEYPWLVRTILSLGSDAELLAPANLREQIVQAAQAISQRHQ